MSCVCNHLLHIHHPLLFSFLFFSSTSHTTPPPPKMPEIAWETLIGALALVALVAGAQYVRTSSSSGSPVKQVVAGEGKKAGAGKKKKGKKAVAAVAVEGKEIGKTEDESRREEKREPAEEVAGSYADVAQKAAQQAGVGHDEVVVPVAGKSSSGKKKNKKAKAAGES